VNIQLNIVTCPTYPDKFIRDTCRALSVLLLVTIVKLIVFYSLLGTIEEAKLLMIERKECVCVCLCVCFTCSRDASVSSVFSVGCQIGWSSRFHMAAR